MSNEKEEELKKIEARKSEVWKEYVVIDEKIKPLEQQLKKIESPPRYQVGRVDGPEIIAYLRSRIRELTAEQKKVFQEYYALQNKIETLKKGAGRLKKVKENLRKRREARGTTARQAGRLRWHRR